MVVTKTREGMGHGRDVPCLTKTRDIKLPWCTHTSARMRSRLAIVARARDRATHLTSLKRSTVVTTFLWQEVTSKDG